jgi:hypothetical protein
MTAGFRLDPQDEYPHPPTSEPNFNESVYVNAFDDRTGMGGWMRLGNRVHERHAELSVCLYLPDGRLAVRFSRPRIAHNDAFDAGGLRFDVVHPMQAMDAWFIGNLFLIEDAEALRDPGVLFERAPQVPAQVVWRLDTISPQHGGEPFSAAQPTMYGRDFSLGHFNQHVRATGHVAIDDQRWEFSPGHGWRDHSWGPRWWTNIHWYRLLLATFPDGRGLMIHKIADSANRARRSGVLLVDGHYREIADFEMLTDWNAARDPRSFTVRVMCEDGYRAEIHGEIVSYAPLRNRREEGGTVLRSRIFEGHTRFTWDGVTGHGMTEMIERVDESGHYAGWPL